MKESVNAGPHKTSITQCSNFHCHDQSFTQVVPNKHTSGLTNIDIKHLNFNSIVIQYLFAIFVTFRVWAAASQPHL